MMQLSKVGGVSSQGKKRELPRRHAYAAENALDSRLGKVIFVYQLLLCATVCHGNYDPNERLGKSSFLSTGDGSSSGSCLKAYKLSTTDSCASVLVDNSISQGQLLLLNPDLNCKNLQDVEKVCVEGVPPNCKEKVSVTGGRNFDGGCEKISATAGLTTQELKSMNPGLICPDITNRSNVWPSSRAICVARGPGSIFIEYMGASGNPITFNDLLPVVNASRAVFHIALGFVIEYARNGSYQNGTFSSYWNELLTPESARAFKINNPGVRLLMSLGGDSLWVNDRITVDVEWYDPPNPEEWIARAQSSLTTIALFYGIDGIDIDFEHFPDDYPARNSSFVYCIGNLIKRLKGNNTIAVATIAPFGRVIPQYEDLAIHFGEFIDYISFQFYYYELPTVSDFVDMFRRISRTFDPTKILASTQVNGKQCITGNLFREAVRQLQQEFGLLGVMLYDADASKNESFVEEISVLSLIPGPYDGQVALPAPAPSPIASQGGRSSGQYRWQEHLLITVAGLAIYNLLHGI